MLQNKRKFHCWFKLRSTQIRTIRITLIPHLSTYNFIPVCHARVGFRVPVTHLDLVLLSAGDPLDGGLRGVEERDEDDDQEHDRSADSSHGEVETWVEALTASV